MSDNHDTQGAATDTGQTPSGVAAAGADEAARAGQSRRARRSHGQALHGEEAASLGRDADHPGQIPRRGWGRVAARVFHEAISDRIGLVAAGCAFYGLLALFPALSLLVSVYGLAFDPSAVERQVSLLDGVLPAPALELLGSMLQGLTSQNPQRLGVGALLALLFTLWTASAGTKALMSALNLAYEQVEQRSFVAFQLAALGFTLAAIAGMAAALACIVALPALLGAFGIAEPFVVRAASLGAMLLAVLVGLSLLYRFGPARTPARWGWITPGSLLATLLWAAASILLSLYVQHFASLDATYGPLGAVVGLLLWFYGTAFVVLLGAELNAELELQTARDTTTGPSERMGSRGAFVADHVAE